ncbi:hypothetical protein PIB30_054271, partial [Stylosanthes scabra]|nr:hypothetical protein [Stylosanthes scabra]
NKQGDGDNNGKGKGKAVANMVADHNEDIIVAMVSECYLVKDSKGWVVDSGATKHICAKKNYFPSFLL